MQLSVSERRGNEDDTGTYSERKGTGTRCVMNELSSVEQIRRLTAIIEQAELYHVHARSRYDPGHMFNLDITGVCPAVTGRARLEVERFVGGGFAGQVYRVKLVELEVDDGSIPGLEVGGVYAIKIIVPSSRFARTFRNAVYWLAYQGPFSAQVNPAAARTGVLWQKLIRRGAKVRFGDERCVADTYATFFDSELGSYGEVNEWIDGRTWKFEVDDEVFRRRKQTADTALYSREYLAKKAFMADLVRLFHDMGAPELARQYEWWTAKSQPNVLKRTDAGDGPADGLTALDFRAGLALLPFLPMIPADFKLILEGLARGALVQFDRGNLDTLHAFCEKHSAEFADIEPALDELDRVDPAYRASLPDVTHHGLRLVYNRGLARSVKEGLVQGWTVQRVVDRPHAERLRHSFFGFWLFYLVGALPVLGKTFRRVWGNAAFARHFRAFLTSFDYMRRTWRARQAELLIDWYRSGRTGDSGIDFFLRHPQVFWLVRVLPGLMPLPAKWHRFLTDWKFAWNTVKHAVAYPIRFYRDAAFRVQWLTGEVETGAEEGMLTRAEKDRILERVPDPFIQKYLKCVAVHICTLPATQIVAVIIAIYASIRFGETWEESVLWAGGVLLFFQGTPISPGSLIRGTYVVYLMVKERNWRNYWIAVLVSYWHYVGYLGFPLQMVKEFPSLARFMAGRWATRMVGFVPVFGERGALLEHWIFDIFFNVPLSIKRRFLQRSASTRT